MGNKNLYRFVVQGEEIRHYGTLGMKWGQRLYQYPDGSLTPLGREHYGYKDKVDTRDPVDRRLAKVKAFNETVSGYVHKRYKFQPKNEKKPTPYKEPTKAEKAKQTKLENQMKKEAIEKAKIAAEEQAKKESKERTDKAKMGFFEDFTDEELQTYINRINLEKTAFDARINKIDVARKVVNEITAYGKAGVEFYNVYRDVLGIVNTHQQQQVEKLSKQFADKELDRLAKEFNNPAFDMSKLKQEDLNKALEILGKIQKIENAYYNSQSVQGNDQDKDKNKKK